MNNYRIIFQVKGYIVLIAFFYATICHAVNVDTIPANNSLIEYTGRIDFTNTLAPKFSFSGVSIRACFSGTSIAVIMNDDLGNNFYNIILDAKLLDTVRIGIGKKTYKLAEGLEDTIHEVEIFKRTELTFGKLQFYGFVLDDGDTLSEIVNKRDKLIEFIGNSVACGYGNEGVNGQIYGPTTENQYMSFAAITSRNFNARQLSVCRSGIGVYRNYAGPITGNIENMLNYYNRIFLYDVNPKYSFTEKPDLICIELGTNDFSTTGGDSAKFIANYLHLIDTIQSKYSMPDIVCLLGPLMSGTPLSNIRRYTNYIADSANNKGKGNVYVFEMSAQTGDLGIGVDYHPTVAQHKRNAQELTNYIKTLKGWKINPLVVSAYVADNRNIRIEFNTTIQDKLNNFSGLKMFGNDQIISIDSSYLDATDKKIIHIQMQENLNIGEKINFSYVPGTVESTDTLLVGKINYIPVQNNLTETIITKGTIGSTGSILTVTCNKNIKKTSSVDGLTITNSQGIIAIDSFKIQNAQLTLYLNEKISKGDSVFASYSGSNLMGIDGIGMSSFQKLVIKNNSTFSSILTNEQTQIEVYPNPSYSGRFYYRLDQSLITENAKLEIYNSSGILVHSQKITNAEGTIDLNGNITKGLYISKFVLGNIIYTRSLIKE